MAASEDGCFQPAAASCGTAAEQLGRSRETWTEMDRLVREFIPLATERGLPLRGLARRRWRLPMRGWRTDPEMALNIAPDGDWEYFYVYDGRRHRLASSAAGPDRCDPTPHYLAEFRVLLARELR
ncbi:hypothetical protein [Nocardia sp. NPDC057353]|uniref:hypothetical protein n=1 Tax=Nocardia sp. NPDC057353 TaxID=3346104 RepID=UPI00362F935B